MSEIKPKEFWIEEANDKPNEWFFGAAYHSQVPDGKLDIHVIEASAYTALRKRCEEINRMLYDQIEQGYALMEIINAKEARIAELEAALESISKNSCCEQCQEAKLVARAALDKKN